MRKYMNDGVNFETNQGKLSQKNALNGSYYLDGTKFERARRRKIKQNSDKKALNTIENIWQRDEKSMTNKINSKYVKRCNEVIEKTNRGNDVEVKEHIKIKF